MYGLDCVVVLCMSDSVYAYICAYASPPTPQWAKPVIKAPSLDQAGTLALPSQPRKGSGGCGRLRSSYLAPPDFSEQQNDRVKRRVGGLEAGS